MSCVPSAYLIILSQHDILPYNLIFNIICTRTTTTTITTTPKNLLCSNQMIPCPFKFMENTFYNKTVGHFDQSGIRVNLITTLCFDIFRLPRAAWFYCSPSQRFIWAEGKISTKKLISNLGTKAEEKNKGWCVNPAVYWAGGPRVIVVVGGQCPLDKGD